MYRVTVEHYFSATHRLQFPDGSWEPLHGHDWRVLATFEAADLDAGDMVIDFHLAQRALAEVLGAFQYRELNAVPAFEGRNPTAELVARHIHDALRARMLPIRRVAVTEALGCEATYDQPV